MAVLQTMAAVRMPAGDSLADEVDIISSVSGGSVTAGYFALTGTAGLPTLEKHFVRRRHDSAHRARVELVGLSRVNSRCRRRHVTFKDGLSFDQQLFKDATYQELIGRRPYLILNAADMVEGVPFPYPEQMDSRAAISRRWFPDGGRFGSLFRSYWSPVTPGRTIGRADRRCGSVDKARETS